MKNYKKIKIVTITLLILVIFTSCVILYRYSSGIDLIQLSAQTSSQMMGYIIKTKSNKIIVIDGGTKGDSNNLLSYLEKYGGHVDYWFLTHPHNDHVGAFEEIIQNSDITVDKIYFSLNSLDTIEVNEPSRLKDAQDLYSTLNNSLVKDKINEVNVDEKLKVDDIEIDILGVKNPEIENNYANNSSMVLKFKVNDKSILFLSDSGIESGNKLLNNQLANLPSDYVQVAHHGQAGVNENVYLAVNPKYCLWPTTIWLWNNDNGGGEDSGTYLTKETRSWINKLNVNKNYVAKDGDIKIRIW